MQQLLLLSKCVIGKTPIQTMDMLYVASDMSKAICRVVNSCNTFFVGDENCSRHQKQKENRMSVNIWSKDKVLSSDLQVFSLR